MPNTERTEISCPKEQSPKTRLGIIDDSDVYIESVSVSFALDNLSLIKIAGDLDQALMAVPTIGERGFCAILVDKNLPDGDGSIVVEAIKQLLPDLPIIGITAAQQATIAGADYQFFKGSGIQVLLDLIENNILKK